MDPAIPKKLDDIGNNGLQRRANLGETGFLDITEVRALADFGSPLYMGREIENIIFGITF
jgi:hypothetical protein